MEATVERKYALIKIQAGDYILPSNDRQTFWRIAKYEDGPSHGLEDWPRDREFWGAWRWLGHVKDLHRGLDDFEGWSLEIDYCERRDEAIMKALRLG